MKKEQTLYNYIINESRDEAVLLALDLLEKNEITILDLYHNVLRKSLYNVDCEESDSDCIWKEHVRTAIVRTIMECAYPYIIKQKKKSINKSVVVVCPSEEYHEIGAKMVHDYFVLDGFTSTFIGANTPITEIILSLKNLQPDFLAISVTNYYNIINTKKIIELAKEINPNIKIVVGGQAFKHRNALETVDNDFYMESHEDIKQLIGDKNVSI